MRKSFVSAAAITATALVLAACGSGDTSNQESAPAAEVASTDEAAPEEPAAAEPADDVAGIGTPVRDGKFEFTVTGVETEVATVGNEYLNKEAQGAFALVSVTVSNIGDEAQTFLGDNAELTDTEGRTHSSDSAAAIYLEGSESWITEINPGNSVDAVVVFDIPVGAAPQSIELHDSMFSNGVTVNLQ